MSAKLSNQFDENVYHLLSDWSVLKAWGSEATKFLNGFCTNDLTKLAEGEVCEAFFTDVKARVLAYTMIFRQSEEVFLVVLSSPHADALATHLDRYLIREKVSLETLTDCQSLFTTDAIDTVNELTSIPLAAYAPNASLLLGSNEAIANALEELNQQNSQPLSEGEFEQQRIALGIPSDRRDVDERNLPQEIDRIEQTISFTKGCYLGQEPVARIDALGQVNWLLRGLVFSSSEVPKPGTELLHEEKVVGRITSSIAFGSGAIGLGYIRRTMATKNASLTYGSANATVMALPFEFDSL